MGVEEPNPFVEVVPGKGNPGWSGEAIIDPEHWVVCPSCDEIVPRGEMNEHVCPVEGLEDE